MDEHLLSSREEYAGVAVPHLVEDVYPLVVVVEQLQRQRQRFALGHLTAMMQMRLDGVERLTGRAVVLVNADEPEERVGVVSEHEQVARLAHVPVVVDPGRFDRRVMQPQGCLDGGGVVPGVVTAAFVRRDDPIAHQMSPSRNRCLSSSSRRSTRNTSRRCDSWSTDSSPATSSAPATTSSRSFSVSGGASSRVHGSSSAGAKWSSMCAMPSGPPARWKVRIGPISAQRRPGPWMIESSICCAVAWPESIMCSASRHNASCRRLPTKPGTSCSIVRQDFPAAV